MGLQFIPTTTLYILSASVTFTLAFITWRLKPERGFTWVMVMVCAGIWSTGTAVETIFISIETKFQIITTIPYLGITGAIFFWSLFTIIYSRHEQWLNKYTVALLAIMPLTTYLLVLSSDYHSLIWDSYWAVEKNGFIYFDQEYGIGFWIWAVYGYLVILLGAVLIVTAVLRSPRLYKGQATVLILGSFIPLISNLLFLVKLNPIAPLDPAPLSFTFTGILITIGLLRFRLFSMVPVAHDQIFRGVTSGVIVIDKKNWIIDLNPAAEKILKQERNELVGQKIGVAFPRNKSLIQRFDKILNAEIEIWHDGKPHTYEFQIMPLTSRSGSKSDGRIILLYDITERKKALAERDALIMELDAYAYTVAHDLKTPLTIITEFSSIIETAEKETLSASSLELLHIINNTSRKMGEIVESLLLLAKINSTEKVEIQPLDMAELINNAWSRVIKNYSETDVEFVVTPHTWPTVVGYAPWVEQVWVNYMSNAVKYGGSPTIVEVGVDEPVTERNRIRPSARFWVKDHGAGLSQEETEQLFQEFTRLEQHKFMGGHGLGLSIAYRIIQRLGGVVGVESKKGHGSTFYFTLPLAEGLQTALNPSPNFEVTLVKQVSK